MCSNCQERINDMMEEGRKLKVVMKAFMIYRFHSKTLCKDVETIMDQKVEEAFRLLVDFNPVSEE